MSRLTLVGLLLLGRPAAAVEVGLSYLALPGTIDYATQDLATGTYSDANEAASLGTVGLRVILDLPGHVGPLTAAIQTGFGVPAGGQTFDRRKVVTYDPTTAALYTHNAKHDGDVTEFNAAVLPLFVMLRSGGPAAGVTFTGEAGVGVLAVGLSVENTETTYDATDATIQSKLVTRDQLAALGLAATAGIGLAVPATDVIDLKVTGGVLWLSDIPFTTTDETASPTLVYGASRADPGLTLGGLGFYLRLGISLNL